MISFDFNVDPREAQYGRFASSVLSMLVVAVEKRIEEGASKSSIAAEIGCDRGQLSRVLNGKISNLTIRTISDILWATKHEPSIAAGAFEDISPNYVRQEPTLAPAVTALPSSVSTSQFSLTNSHVSPATVRSTYAQFEPV